MYATVMLSGSHESFLDVRGDACLATKEPAIFFDLDFLPRDLTDTMTFGTLRVALP